MKIINKLFNDSKKAIYDYDGRSVLEMKERMVAELEELRCLIVKELNNENS